VPAAKAQEEEEKGCSGISEGAILVACNTTFEQAAKNINRRFCSEESWKWRVYIFSIQTSR
jgi:hypothetical protein